MAKHTETIEVYDHKARTSRVVKLEVTAPQFVLECLEEGKLSNQLAAQEAFDTPTKKIVIEVSVKVPKR